MTSFHTPQSACRFGLARRDITPPVGIYHRMWGAALHDRSEGIHRPLLASAMVFEPSTGSDTSTASRQVVIALDHCLLFHPQIMQITERVCERTNVPAEQVLITFSHTHGAGLMDPGRGNLPGGDLIGPYLERLANLVAEAVEEALASLAPAVLSYGTGRCSLAAHRDYWDEASGQFVCGFNPHQPADDTLLVIRATAAEGGKLLATLVNYACHPTTLAYENRLISPDYPGALREVVEQASGAPCVFLQGASGDLGPRDGYVGDASVADANGRQAGYAALAALEALPPPATAYRYQGPVVSGATLGVWRHEPLRDDEGARLARWQLRRGIVELPYRPGLPTLEETREQLAHWKGEEAAARAANDELKTRDAHAMVERQTRWLTRLSALPPGASFPFPYTLMQVGSAIWLGVEGEPYNLLQRTLRERFPKTPLVVMVLSGGSRAWYLPTSETYGKGIYQESMANLAPGCLERLVTALEGDLRRLIDTDN
jgi:hypothetical protein